jgi:hypothetical protein
MTPSLHEIARDLGGRVVCDRTGPHVVGQKGADRSLSVWVDGDKIRVHSHRGRDWPTCQAYARERCGLEQWKPVRSKRVSKTVPFRTRNMFFGETLAICRYKAIITFEQFGLLINDLMLRGDTEKAISYARAFGFTASDLERAIQAPLRHYTADERAKIFGLTYAERQHLGLRRTGSIDVDKAGRERARRDRYNAQRRAARQAARSVKAVASIEVPSSQVAVGKQRDSSKVRDVTAYTEVTASGRERWKNGYLQEGRGLGSRKNDAVAATCGADTT